MVMDILDIGYIEALAGSFEYIHNSIKMFNDSIEKSSRTRKDFDLTFFTNPRLLNNNISKEKGNRSPMTGETVDEIGSDLSMFKESGVDRIILGMNAGKDYSLNETIEFFKDLKKFCQ